VRCVPVGCRRSFAGLKGQNVIAQGQARRVRRAWPSPWVRLSICLVSPERAGSSSRRVWRKRYFALSGLADSSDACPGRRHARGARLPCPGLSHRGLSDRILVVDRYAPFVDVCELILVNKKSPPEGTFAFRWARLDTRCERALLDTCVSC
jgi:hypothetical protein